MTTEADTKKKTNWVVDETVNAVPKTQADVVDENVKENWFLAFGELGEIKWREMDHGFSMPGKADAMRNITDATGKVLRKERYDVFKPKYVGCPAEMLIDESLPESKRYKTENLTRCDESPPKSLKGKPLMRWCQVHMREEHADLYYEMHKGTVNPVCDTQYNIPANDGRTEAPPQHFVVEFKDWKPAGANSMAHMSKDDTELEKMRDAYKKNKGSKSASEHKEKVEDVKEAIKTEEK